jgi:DNA-binding CsgD family transcriptional regulator
MAAVPATDRLTPAEERVLTLLAEGLSNAQIAHLLSIGEQGVKFHVSNLLSKLGVQNRRQAMRWWFDHNTPVSELPTLTLVTPAVDEPEPEGHIRLTCVECRGQWTIKRRRGQYPRVCPSCTASAQARRDDAELRRRRERQTAAASEAIRARSDKLLGRNLAKRWAGLITDPEVMRHQDALMAMLDRLPATRHDPQALKAAVVRVAHAEGIGPTRAALEQLAAVALARASAIGTRAE